MPRNDDGEFELILGNRQLLSVFFIVVILMGVFFTMGYIVGRNSSPLTVETRKPGQPVMVEPAPSQANPAPVPAAPRENAAPAQSEIAKAAEGATRTEAAKAEKPAPPPETQPEPRAAERPRPASPMPDQPVAGATYLQVAAVAKAEAELFVDVLAKKGFQAVYASIPDKPQTFRVLVGPLKDSATISQARGDLQKAGFKGFDAIVRRY
jgi:cell division septation protein DedD